MEFQLGQHIKMKKEHPCGTNDWEILRVGMDFRLKCSGCGHMIMVPRKTVEKLLLCETLHNFLAPF